MTHQLPMKPDPPVTSTVPFSLMVAPRPQRCDPVRPRLRGMPRARPGSRPADERPVGSSTDEHIAERSCECRHLQGMALRADVNRYFDLVYNQVLGIAPRR